jgi:hypothetical protein
VKVIILEGPDGSGKTTLANVLGKDHKYKIIHNGPPVDKNLTDIYIGQLRFVDGEGGNYVFDRLHLGERIYGNVMRNKSLINPMEEKIIERHSEAMDAQVVLCLPPWRTVLENWVRNAANEYVDTVEKLKTIHEMYVKLLYSGRPYVWFDYTRHRVHSFANALVALEGTPLPKGVIGSQRPRFLFVGKVTPKLNNNIFHAGFKEQEIAFTNEIKYWDIGSIPKVIDVSAEIPSVTKLADIRRSVK